MSHFQAFRQLLIDTSKGDKVGGKQLMRTSILQQKLWAHRCVDLAAGTYFRPTSNNFSRKAFPADSGLTACISAALLTFTGFLFIVVL